MAYDFDIAVVGGDKRQTYLGELLKEHGFSVTMHGFGAGADYSKISESGAVVLPMPATDGNGKIHTPLWDGCIMTRQVADCLAEGTPVFAGKAGEDLSSICNERGLVLVDYLEREELAVLNAIPTAEGAIAIAMQKREQTLFGARVLVCGMGRIAKMLLALLDAFGAQVTVAARKPADRVWAGYSGAREAVTFGEIAGISGRFDIIFNTVPHLVIDRDVLKGVSPDCLIIDLASKPGGVDLDAAGEAGLAVEWALSLPGKVAPKSAAAAVYTAIVGAMEEMGMLS